MLESYLEVGFNYRMTDIQAAVGLVQLGQARRDGRAAGASSPRATRRCSPTSPACERCGDPAWGAVQLPVLLGRAGRAVPADPERPARRARRARGSRPGRGSWPRTASPPTPGHAHADLAGDRAADRQHPHPSALPHDDRPRTGRRRRCDPPDGRRSGRVTAALAPAVQLDPVPPTPRRPPCERDPARRPVRAARRDRRRGRERVRRRPRRGRLHRRQGRRRVRAGVRRVRRRPATASAWPTAPTRSRWRCAPSASGPATRSSCRRTPSSPPPRPSCGRARGRSSSTSTTRGS